MWKIIAIAIGVIITIIAKSIIWEVIGLGIIIGIALMPKRRKKFRKIT